MQSSAQISGTGAPDAHCVQFYGHDEPLLADTLTRYLAEGLARGQGLLLVATPERRRALSDHAGRAEREGRLAFLDARETLARFMVHGQPDWERFENTVGGAIREMRARLGDAGLRAYGEMVGLLWKAGQLAAALRLEEYWNRLLRDNGFALLCAYPIDILAEEVSVSAVSGVLCAHSHLLPAGRDEHLEAAVNAAMDEVLGPRATGLRGLMKANFRPAWPAMPRPYANVLWLRSNLPQYAGEILLRAREHYRAAWSDRDVRN